MKATDKNLSWIKKFVYFYPNLSWISKFLSFAKFPDFQIWRLPFPKNDKKTKSKIRLNNSSAESYDVLFKTGLIKKYWEQRRI